MFSSKSPHTHVSKCLEFSPIEGCKAFSTHRSTATTGEVVTGSVVGDLTTDLTTFADHACLSGAASASTSISRIVAEHP